MGFWSGGARRKLSTPRGRVRRTLEGPPQRRRDAEKKLSDRGVALGVVFLARGGAGGAMVMAGD